MYGGHYTTIHPWTRTYWGHCTTCHPQTWTYGGHFHSQTTLSGWWKGQEWVRMPTASLPQALSVFAEASTPHLSPPHPSPLLSLFITAKQVMFLICWHHQCTVRRFRPLEWSIPWMMWLGPSLLVPFSFLWWNTLPAQPGQRSILTHGLRHAGHDGGGMAAEVWRDWSLSLKPGSRVDRKWGKLCKPKASSTTHLLQSLSLHLNFHSVPQQCHQMGTKHSSTWTSGRLLTIKPPSLWS